MTMKVLRGSSQRSTCIALAPLPVLLLLLAGTMMAFSATAREDPLMTSPDVADGDITTETATPPRPLLPKPAAAMQPKAAPARVLQPTVNAPENAFANPTATANTTATRGAAVPKAGPKRSLMPKTFTATPGVTAGTAGMTDVPQPQPSAPCDKPCYTVADYWPYKTCRAECSLEICKRGWAVWGSQEICCAAGAAFPDGCSVRPKECWVAESPSSRSCWRDDRKCLQGYGVWPSEEVCCSPGAAFPDGCLPAEIAPANTNCWVVDTYFPARLCRNTTNLCSPRAGVQSWPTKEACCARGGAFPEGCSPAPPPTPCFMVGSYWPARTCVASDDIAVCNRGWGVYASEEICCAPNVAFSEGCSAPPSGTEPSSGSSSTAAAAGARPAVRAPLPAKAVRLAPVATVPQSAGLNDLK